jgi:ribosomal protein S27E/5S rRNA maturation endonuclease (ribonuclease M5)
MNTVLSRYAASELAKGHGIRPRASWIHVKCPMCHDKSAHLGINTQTGQIRCLKCGSTSRLQGFHAGPTKIPVKKRQQENLDSLFTSEIDATVASYLSGRGIALPDPAVACGRGKADGCPCFLSIGSTGDVVYLQWRRIDRKQYVSPDGTLPRLSFVGHKAENRKHLLILTEGPVDAIKVRQATGCWSSPLCGVTLNSNYLADIIESGADMVLVALDNDTTGRFATSKVSTILESVGLCVRCVDWGGTQHKDFGDMNHAEIRWTVKTSLMLDEDRRQEVSSDGITGSTGH